jgi:hypothetical protein
LGNLSAEIRDAVHESGLTSIKLSSAARSPWHQATVIGPALAAGRPAAPYDNSNHMFGQAADIWMPAKEGTPQYEAAKKVLAHFGLTLPVASDPVHVELAKPNASADATRLAMIRGCEAVARKIKEAQTVSREELLFVRDKLNEQKEQLNRDLNARRSEREKKTSIFNEVSAKYLQLTAEIARAQAMKRAKEEAELLKNREQAAPAASNGSRREPATHIPREPREVAQPVDVRNTGPTERPPVNKAPAAPKVREPKELATRILG